MTEMTKNDDMTIAIYILYIIGSLCFLAGSAVSLVREVASWEKKNTAVTQAFSNKQTGRTKIGFRGEEYRTNG